ncbi:unnamed protein product [Meloidogyne enterolobii]|uniref:Uncharacterized protein n=1 Tax=Meloidogyne enterolobii TaxID=390850 RepID=A0ACB0YI91_MELEN
MDRVRNKTNGMAAATVILLRVVIPCFDPAPLGFSFLILFCLSISGGGSSSASSSNGGMFNVDFGGT